jgi:predicted molibdopterin-dependent oxidoreductase YjgC
MVVETESERVIKSRKINIELLLASGHHNCLTCEANGDCRLQELAYRYKVETIRFPESPIRYPTETSNPLIIRDFFRCILCGRCVQACNEVQVNKAISFGYRGSASKIVAVGDLPLDESDCVFCGECVQVCPVGALIEKQSRFKGRVWEAKKVQTTCPYCGVGCQIYLHIKNNNILKITGVEDAPPNFGSLCVKGRFGYDFINQDERLTTPLIKVNGHFREASWNENNVDHCARLCHASTVAGLAAAFGSGAMTNPIADIEKSEVILVTGSNMTEAHPVISSYIKKRVEFGSVKLIVIDPRRIPLTKFATLWLRQNLGTDVAWANGMMHVIIKENLYDKSYVQNRTEGFEELKKTVEKYSPEYVSKITGIPADDLIKVARSIYAMWQCRHTRGRRKPLKRTE